MHRLGLLGAGQFTLGKLLGRRGLLRPLATRPLPCLAVGDEFGLLVHLAAADRTIGRLHRIHRGVDRIKFAEVSESLRDRSQSSTSIKALGHLIPRETLRLLRLPPSYDLLYGIVDIGLVTTFSFTKDLFFNLICPIRIDAPLFQLKCGHPFWIDLNPFDFLRGFLSGGLKPGLPYGSQCL